MVIGVAVALMAWFDQWRFEDRQRCLQAKMYADIASGEYWYARTYTWPEEDERHRAVAG